MNNPENDWPLVDPDDYGIRPAGPPDRCFYCTQPVGQPHQRDCVIVTKLVRFRVIADIDITLPHWWTTKTILERLHGPSSGRIRDHYTESSLMCEVLDVFEQIKSNVHLPDPTTVDYVGVVDETPRRALRDAN